MNQRGNIALYLLFSLAVATAAGYGVYVLLRDRPRAAADADVPPAQRAETRSVTPTPAATPVAEVPVEPAHDVGDDRAELKAIAPADIDDPDRDTVLLGTPGVAGSLEPTQIERTMKRYMVRWERCMRRARERSELTRGDLRLAFVIAADGSVAGMSYESSIEVELASCVTDVVKKLRFDKPTDGALVKVVVPMAFVPARDGSDPLVR